jgi:hypothetical protein
MTTGVPAKKRSGLSEFAMVRELARHAILVDPGGQAALIQFTRRDRERGLDGVQLIGHKLDAVDGEEHTNREESRAFVAIYDGMVLRKAEGVGGRKICHGAFGVISMCVLRTRQEAGRAAEVDIGSHHPKYF